MTSVVDVICPKGKPGKIMIICGVEISPDQREAFDRLDDDGKNDFLWRPHLVPSPFRGNTNSHFHGTGRMKPRIKYIVTDDPDNAWPGA